MKRGSAKDFGLYFLTLLVAVCFPLIFSGRNLSGILSGVDFWSLFASTLLIFLIIVLGLDPFFSRLIFDEFRERTGFKFLVGLGSAFLLYGIFWAGSVILLRISPEATKYLASVYGFKSGESNLRIGIFLALIIGPGEELLWRGFLQRHWSARLGKWGGFLVVALLYAAVHLPTRNPLLVLAALVCGLWWGYQYLRIESVLANVVSHIVWDLAVFIIFPF